MGLYIPRKVLRSSQFPKWFSADLRHCYKCLKSLRRGCSRNPNPTKMAKLKSEEESFQLSSVEAKGHYEMDLITNCQLRQLGYLLRKGGSIPSTLYLDSTLATSYSARMSLFNNFFSSVFTRSSLCYLQQSISPVLIMGSHPLRSPNLMYSTLSSLDTSKAMGMDGIGPKVLQSSELSICSPLQHLFQMCLAKQTIPAEWRIHNITPIHKSGDCASVSNYRPISLLSSTSKVGIQQVC